MKKIDEYPHITDMGRIFIQRIGYEETTTRPVDILN